MTVPNIRNAHDPETRNIINAAIDLINAQGKSIQDLVAEGQLTPDQYSELLRNLNNLTSADEVFLKSKGININDFDETTKRAFLEAQNIDVNYILGEESVKDKNLSDGLSPDKLKHISNLPKTVNILNPEEFIDNGYYRITDGSWVISSSYKNSGLIPINPGERFSKPQNSFVTYWSAGESFISGHNASANFVAHTDQRIAYMRVALTAPTPYPEWMVVRGSDYPTRFIPYEKEYILNPEYYKLEDVILTEEQKNILKKLDNVDITKLKNIDFKRINHIDPKAIENGGYYRASDGVWVVESSGRTVSSGLIEVNKKESWVKSQNSIVTYWDENGVFVSGRNANVTFTVPDDDAIKFMRTSMTNTDTPFEEWMLIKGDELPDIFIPYDEIELIGIGGSVDFDTSLISSISPNALNTINATAQSVPGNFTDQVTHPSLVAFETNWNGYKYWMAITPYPYGNSFHENPCIICSNNLIDWVEPSSNVNPLDSTADNSIFYNSDTELLMVGDTMELWWRRRNNSPHSEEFYRRTSKDGVNWTSKQLTFSQNTGAGAVSPSVIFDEGIYKMWTINGETGLISYHESETGDNFTKVRDINIGLNIWHGSVKRSDEGLYEMYASYGRRHKNYHIVYAYSEDNINWSTPEKVLSAVPERHDAELYRPTFFDMPWSGRRNKLRIIAYGVISDDNLWGIGISIAYKENPTSLRGLDF